MPATREALVRRSLLSASRVARVAFACGAFTTLVGVVVIGVGFALNVPAVRSVVPGTVAMKASTALMFTLCGTSLMFLGARAGGGESDRYARLRAWQSRWRSSRST